MSRPETGPMQFGDDWPGVFVRGDDAFGYAEALDSLFNVDPYTSEANWALGTLMGLLRHLRSCDTRRKLPVQVLRPFDDCATEEPPR